MNMKNVTFSEHYSDAEIIQKILDSEITLFEILIRRYNALLYKTGRSYNYNPRKYPGFNAGYIY
jgi:hypothetical protein